jgi:predicted transcriptional regulator
MILKILNKTNFLQKFLLPISRINDLCTLTVTEDSIFNLNRTPDNNFSLYATSSDVEVLEYTQNKNLSFSDIKKFIKAFDCIQEDVIELQLNDNTVEYKSSGTKFKFHLINDNIVRAPNFNIDKINSFEYNLHFKLNNSVITTLLKSSTFLSDSNKIYISTDNGRVIGEMTDKTRSNIDSYSTILCEAFGGDEMTKSLAFNFDLFRNISSVKSSDMDVRLNTNKGVIAFDIVDDNYKLKYISTAHVS